MVSGSVQGVGFRFFVQGKAIALELTGWARNLDNGTVEVYACGSPQQLDDLAGALHAGPRTADVRNVEQQDVPVETHAGFRIR